MGFTFKALLPPFVCFILFGLATDKQALTNTTGWLGVLIMAWGFLAFAAVFFYWVGRLWKRATRDSADTYFQR
jgi:hypothetical protein